MWLAGGGIKGGIIYGATDEFGHRAAVNDVVPTTTTPRSSTSSASTTMPRLSIQRPRAKANRQPPGKNRQRIARLKRA